MKGIWACEEHDVFTGTVKFLLLKAPIEIFASEVLQRKKTKCWKFSSNFNNTIESLIKHLTAYKVHCWQILEDVIDINSLLSQSSVTFEFYLCPPSLQLNGKGQSAAVS